MKKIILVVLTILSTIANAQFVEKDIETMAYTIGRTSGGTRFVVPRFTIGNNFECSVANTVDTMKSFCRRTIGQPKVISFKLGGAGSCMILKKSNGKFDLMNHDEPEFRKYKAVTELVCGE